jgi:hypothetical protein
MATVFVVAAFDFRSGSEAEVGRARADESAGEHRSPVDVVLSRNASWLVTANETSNSISLVRLADRRVLDEIKVGERPATLDLCLDGQHVVVTCAYSGEAFVVQVEGEKLRIRSSIQLGFEPTGLAVHPDGKRAFVGLAGGDEVAELDLESAQVNRRIAVGSWPRHLALSPDGSRLAVGCSGASIVVVVDTDSGKVLYDERLASAINIGRMTCSADGKYVYFPWMVYRSNPLTRGNIRRGWVLASRIARVRLDGPSYREAISLDVPGQAVADPHGIAIGADAKRLVVAASGTHELLVYRRGDLPFIGVGGPGDLIDRRLLRDRDMFYRIDLGGRPMGMEMADSRIAYVANFLRDSVQVVDVEARKILAEIDLNRTPVEPTLARRGMEIFYDGRRSLDQWYSCHSCHYNGGISSRAMDTWNDGSDLTMKTVPPLFHVHKTKPWTWHGWQTSLDDAMSKSFTITMQGQPISDEDSRAVQTFLQTLTPPPNPFLQPDGSLSPAAARGKIVFESKLAGCIECHSGPFFTDGKIHDVGSGEDGDKYTGFNTPGLRSVYRKVRLLHDGSEKTLEGVLTGPHVAEEVGGEGPLSEKQLSDLIAYLKSL